MKKSFSEKYELNFSLMFGELADIIRNMSEEDKQKDEFKKWIELRNLMGTFCGLDWKNINTK